jgi:hypothetical protein
MKWSMAFLVFGAAMPGVAAALPGASGPLKAGSNPHYFTDATGKAVLLAGSHTWNDFQDTDEGASSPPPFDFSGYVAFLKSHGHNATILWKKDLPTYCGWGPGGTWHATNFPWMRTGGSAGTLLASDGLPAFDLTQFDQAYFGRLRTRAVVLQRNGIYAVVQLFDGLGLLTNRCVNDGYPFTAGNNTNNVDDGGGTNSMTMTGANAITMFQDAYVRKVIDTLNDLPNVLWEVSEEAPSNSTWWHGHMIDLIHAYERTKPLQHPVGWPALTGGSDSLLYDSNADWVAPIARTSPTQSCGAGSPACKVDINDSDHSYFGLWLDSPQQNRNYVWNNFTNGNSVMFMDPYEIYWSAQNRNLCSNPVHGVCAAVDPHYDNLRNNLGYVLKYANTRLDLEKMVPAGQLSSTGQCLANAVSLGAQYLVYAPTGGSFTVDLSGTNRPLDVEWFDPSTGTTVPASPVTGGSRSQTFIPPSGFTGDAVLYLADSATATLVPAMGAVGAGTAAILLLLAGLGRSAAVGRNGNCCTGSHRYRETSCRKASTKGLWKSHLRQCFLGIVVSCEVSSGGRGRGVAVFGPLWSPTHPVVQKGGSLAGNDSASASSIRSS